MASHVNGSIGVKCANPNCPVICGCGDDDLKIIALDAELKATNADSFRDEVIALIDTKPITVSMEKCTYVSSAGLRAML